MLVFALAVATALVVSFVCSLCEAVLLSVRHAQVEALQGTRAGQILRRFKREVDAPIAAILILNTVAHTAGASVAGASFAHVWDESQLWIFTTVFTIAVLLFTEIVPKTLGVTLAARLAVPVAYGVQLMVTILRPIIFVTGLVSRMLTSRERAPVTSLEEIRLLTALGRSEGVLQKGVAGMIEGTVRLRELRARDVMVPRGNMVYLSGARSVEENLRLAMETGHSRFPFSLSGNPDQLDGIVLIKDLLFQLQATPGQPHWETLLGKPLVVPVSMPLERLLQTFREQRRHLALVVDEYGGTQGLVTMEDVLEEIVGEIEDEYDRVHSFIVKRADGSLLCRGWAETRKVFEALGLGVETDSVSLGGFIAEKVDRVPRAGDVVRADGVEFRVLIASPRRAESIEVRRVAPSMMPPP
jgi:CBS domain containing-hemolysin-like protein